MKLSMPIIGRTLVVTICATSQAWAQSQPVQADVRNIVVADAGDQLQEVTVTSERLNLMGTATTASEGVVVNDELALTPVYRPGQLLETVPGLTVTIHSGEGKANQYLLRGYSLDHGTDIALFVDGMPVNEPTHAHGQGYADLNFMIPELATNVAYTKGTYYADEGDFASVGSVHTSYLDKLDNQASVAVGTNSFQRLVSAASQTLQNGSHLLEALELQHYAGPWDHSDDQRKLNAVLRYSSGDDKNGYSVTGMLYHDLWNATTDQPERAVAARLISRDGTLDPHDGGYAQRTSLSAQYRSALDGGELSANAYVVNNRLTLWNDFTHFLLNPIDGDQEQQQEDRVTLGADSSYAWTVSRLGASTDWLAGLHTRLDFNDTSRLPIADRVLLTQSQLDAVDYPRSAIERDQVRLNSVAAYIQATSHWTDRFRSVLGVREDYLEGSDVGTNAGSAHAALLQPKVSLIYRLSPATEVYASWGRGFHSDDLRGVTQAASSGTASAPLIARQTGEEIGVREEFLRNLSATLSVYSLRAESETTYDPDVGTDSAGPGSERRGFEVNVTYQALRWLEFYGSYSANRARYTTPSDDGTGHIGYYLPNAPFASGSFNVYVKNLGSWSGGLEYRYLGAYPLSTDDLVQGRGYGEWDLNAHYAVGGGWQLGLGVYNLLNKKADAMEYWYVDRLPDEPVDGVADVHFHPLEPLETRFTVSKSF